MGVAEGKEEACHVVVMLGRRLCAAGDPVKKVGIGTFQQGLVAVELAVVKAAEMRVGKAAEDQVALPRAAMPGTEREPLPANVR